MRLITCYNATNGNQSVDYSTRIYFEEMVCNNDLMIIVAGSMSSTFCIITAHENVWKEVLGMSDQVPVKYENLEQLFCQKQIQKSKGNTKPKVPSVVSIRVHEKDMIIIRIPIRVFISVWEICLIYPQCHLSGQSINEKQEILL